MNGHDSFAGASRAGDAGRARKNLFHDRLLRGMQENDPALPRKRQRLLKLCGVLDHADAPQRIWMSKGIGSNDRRRNF